jgi:predicted dehydrogenase
MRSVSAYRHLAAAAQSGEHGRLLGLSTWRLGSYLRPDAPHRKAHHGPPATELMTFDFDVVRWIMGAPKRLSATGGDRVTARLEFDDGRYATVVASGLMPVDVPFTVGFRATFERAAMELHTVFDSLPPRNTFTMAVGNGAPRPIELVQHDPYSVELRHFVDCMRGSADPAWLDADRAIEALGLSLATGQALVNAGAVTVG